MVVFSGLLLLVGLVLVALGLVALLSPAHRSTSFKVAVAGAAMVTIGYVLGPGTHPEISNKGPAVSPSAVAAAAATAQVPAPQALVQAVSALPGAITANIDHRDLTVRFSAETADDYLADVRRTMEAVQAQPANPSMPEITDLTFEEPDHDRLGNSSTNPTARLTYALADLRAVHWERLSNRERLELARDVVIISPAGADNLGELCGGKLTPNATTGGTICD